MTNRLYLAKGISGEDFHHRMREKYPSTEAECELLYDIDGAAVMVSSSNPKATRVRVVAKTIDEVGQMKRDISIRVGVELVPDRDGRRYEKFRRMR